VPALADHVDDGPVIFSPLQVMDRQFRQFTAAQPAAEHYANERGVRLPLDRSWPCTAWQVVCDPNALWSARLIMTAEGYAPVTSRVFYLLGTQSPGAGPPGAKIDTVTISFSGVPEIRVHVKEGDSGEVNIPFHRPVRRVLRVTDQQGKPLSGIGIWDQLLFAQSNHCGAVEGETLVRGQTNANGELTIPDVSGECAFEIDDLKHYELRESLHVSKPIIAVRELRDPITTIVLRSLEKRTGLQLEFKNHGIPAAGLQLISCLSVACGAGCGLIEGETDQNGRVVLKEYYPEEVYLILADHNDKVYWQGPVPPPAKSDWTRVEISK